MTQLELDFWMSGEVRWISVQRPFPRSCSSRMGIWSQGLSTALVLAFKFVLFSQHHPAEFSMNVLVIPVCQKTLQALNNARDYGCTMSLAVIFPRLMNFKEQAEFYDWLVSRQIGWRVQHVRRRSEFITIYPTIVHSILTLDKSTQFASVGDAIFIDRFGSCERVWSG